MNWCLLGYDSKTLHQQTAGHTDTYTYTHTHALTYTHTHTHALTHTYTHTHALTYTHIHTHTHTHTHTYTNNSFSQILSHSVMVGLPAPDTNGSGLDACQQHSSSWSQATEYTGQPWWEDQDSRLWTVENNRAQSGSINTGETWECVTIVTSLGVLLCSSWY